MKLLITAGDVALTRLYRSEDYFDILRIPHKHDVRSFFNIVPACVLFFKTKTAIGPSMLRGRISASITLDISLYIAIKILKLFRKTIINLIIIFISTHVTSVFSEEWPIQIIGEWQIVEVHLNTEASRTSLYRWNDPRLIGRLFRFGRQIVWDNTPEQSGCTTPSVRTLSMGPEDLIRHSLARYGYPPQHPNAIDYQINLRGSGARSVFRIYSGEKLWQGGLGADFGLKGAWMMQSDDPSQLLLRWYDETIVVLKKMKSELSISASFDCSKSKNFTEESICGSRELASFDQSIATAYKQLLAQNNDEAKNKENLINDQRLWMIKRNACEFDENCVLKIMRSRLEFLSVQNPTLKDY